MSPEKRREKNRKNGLIEESLIKNNKKPKPKLNLMIQTGFDEDDELEFTNDAEEEILTTRNRNDENELIRSVEDARQAILSASEFLTQAVAKFSSLG